MNRPRIETTDLRAYGPRFTLARTTALQRSRGWCQLCGYRRATQAHHWARTYPDPHELTADDLTALCARCHELATRLRREERARLDRLRPGVTFGAGRIDGLEEQHGTKDNTARAVYPNPKRGWRTHSHTR